MKKTMETKQKNEEKWEGKVRRKKDLNEEGKI